MILAAMESWLNVYLLVVVLLGTSNEIKAVNGSVSPDRLCVCPGDEGTFTCSVEGSGGVFTWITNTTTETCQVFSSSPQSQCGKFIGQLQNSSLSTLTATSNATSDPGNILIQCYYIVDLVGNATLQVAGTPPTPILHNVTSGDIQDNGDDDTRNATLRWTMSEPDDCFNTIHFNVTPDDPTHCGSCEVGPGMQEEFSCQVMQGIGQNCTYRVYAVCCGDTQNGTMSEPVEVHVPVTSSSPLPPPVTSSSPHSPLVTSSSPPPPPVTSSPPPSVTSSSPHPPPVTSSSPHSPLVTSSSPRPSPVTSSPPPSVTSSSPHPPPVTSSPPPSVTSSSTHPMASSSPHPPPVTSSSPYPPPVTSSSAMTPTWVGALDPSDDSGCSFSKCWFYILLIVISVLLLIAIIIVVACIGYVRRRTKKKGVWRTQETPQDPNRELDEVALPDIGVELSHYVYYADPDEFKIDKDGKNNIYSADPKTSRENGAAAGDSDQMEDNPEDHIPTYADPRTIERETAPETGDAYTLVDMSKKKEKQVPVVMEEEDPYEPVEIEKTDQLTELHYAVLDLFQNEEEPQTVPPLEEPVQYSVINPSGETHPPPEEGNKIQTSTTIV